MAGSFKSVNDVNKDSVLREMKLKGAIGFSHTDGWLTKVIRFFRDGAEFTHVFVVIADDEKSEPLLQHAIETGVAITEMLYDGKESAFELYMPQEGNIQKALDEILKFRGTGYGYLQLIGFVFVWFMHKIGIKKTNPFNRGIICSELVWIYVKALGIGRILGEKWEDIDRDDVAPDHLRNGFLKNIDCVKLVAKKKLGTEEIEVVE